MNKIKIYGPLCRFGQCGSRVGRGQGGRGTQAFWVELSSDWLLRGMALLHHCGILGSGLNVSGRL